MVTIQEGKYGTEIENNKPQFWMGEKSTGSIYLPGSKYCKDEGLLKLISCLQDAVVNSAPKIAKCINKPELYKQFPPRKVKDTNMSDMENTLFVIIIINVNPVFQVEI